LSISRVKKWARSYFSRKIDSLICYSVVEKTSSLYPLPRAQASTRACTCGGRSLHLRKQVAGTQSTWRGNRFAFPLPTVARTSSGLPASPSRAGHEPAPCDQGGIPPWIPQRSVPRGKPRGISTDRKIKSIPLELFPFLLESDIQCFQLL